MIQIKSRWKRLAGRDRWAARRAALVAKIKATKAVWFPPKFVGDGTSPASTAKTTTAPTQKTTKAPAKAPAKKTAKAPAKKTAKAPTKKSTGAAKKPTNGTEP